MDSCLCIDTDSPAPGLYRATRDWTVQLAAGQ